MSFNFFTSCVANYKSRSAFRERLIGQLLQFVNCFREIIFQQSRQRAIGKQFTIGLTSGTVIGFFVRIPNSLNNRAACRTRSTELPMNSHFRSAGLHLLRELITRLMVKQINPMPSGRSNRLEQDFDFSFKQW